MFKSAEFLNFVSRYDAKFPTTVTGATPDEIEQLQKVVGRPLPESYRQFLSVMGRNAGCINLGNDHNTDGTTDIRVIEQWYREFINEGHHRVPPHCISISLSGPVFDVCLQEVEPFQEPRVVYSEGACIYEQYAETLEKLLYRLAFSQYQPKRWAHLSLFRSILKERLIDRARDWASSAGFSALWFSDHVAFCAERMNTSIFLWQYEREFLHARIVGASADVISSLGLALSTQLGMREVKE